MRGVVLWERPEYGDPAAVENDALHVVAQDLAPDISLADESRLQEKLFIWLAGSAEDATTYFRIPSDRVVEIGTQIVI